MFSLISKPCYYAHLKVFNFKFTSTSIIRQSLIFAQTEHWLSFDFAKIIAKILIYANSALGDLRTTRNLQAILYLKKGSPILKTKSIGWH